MSDHADRGELYAMVESLPPAEMRRILRLIVGELSLSAEMETGHRLARRQAPRNLSVFGMIEDEPDAASRSEEILRERFSSTK